MPPPPLQLCTGAAGCGGGVGFRTYTVGADWAAACCGWTAWAALRPLWKSSDLLLADLSAPHLNAYIMPTAARIRTTKRVPTPRITQRQVLSLFGGSACR